MAVVTNMPIQLSYFVADITTALLTYDRLRWWRSRTGQQGLYEQATAAAATSAVLTGTADTPHAVNGKTLTFTVDGASPFSVTFAGADPVTTATVAGEINAAVAGALVAADDGNGYLQLTSATTGSGSSIEITGGDAAPYLGLAEGDGAVGLDADITLVSGTHQYFYTDQNSGADFWYRVEFFNSSSLVTGGLGVPILANADDAVPVAQTITGYIRLASPTGSPDVGRRIIFANPALPNKSSDGLWGILKQYVAGETDRNGYAEVRLLRGIQIDFNLVGTGFTRRITVPTTGDSFDLLDPALDVQDEFGIQEPDIDYAIRTT